MSQSEIARKEILFKRPAEGSVDLQRDLPAGSLRLDVYRPANVGNEPLPAVVIVAGYVDAGFVRMLGCSFKDMGSTVSWARLIAAECGCAVVAYASDGEPDRDCAAVLHFLRNEGAKLLKIELSRIALMASSGNVPVGVSMLVNQQPVRCAVFCYGYLIGPKVEEAAQQFRFANPCRDLSVSDLPAHTPLLIVRAGEDAFPGLNESIDAFVALSLRRNLPLRLINLPNAPHAFDLFLDGAETRDAIRDVLAFLRNQLA